MKKKIAEFSIKVSENSRGTKSVARVLEIGDSQFLDVIVLYTEVRVLMHRFEKMLVKMQDELDAEQKGQGKNQGRIDLN